MTDLKKVCDYYKCIEPIDEENVPLDGSDLRYCPRHTEQLNTIIRNEKANNQVGGSLDSFRWYVGACGPMWSQMVNA